MATVDERKSIAHQPQPLSAYFRLERVSVTSTTKHAINIDEPSLRMTLNLRSRYHEPWGSLPSCVQARMLSGYVYIDSLPLPNKGRSISGTD